jgi:two-component system, cell cycle sensor histidine kinase and response regulator CckA
VIEGKPLRLLLVEDSEDDTLLVLRELRRAGYDVDYLRVQTESDMQRALAEREWDLVISDYSMPEFTGPRALAVLRASGRDLPFIMLSGTVNEETAVEALHAGAHDFMVKSKLARLAPAIERELRDVAARRARKEAEEEVKRLEEQVRQAQKMDAIGRLAGGVAHDFNNILTAIMATADLALASPGVDEELRKDLESIRDAGARAAAITRQLLTFSRKQVVALRPVDIGDTVVRIEPLLRRLVPSEMRLEFQVASTGLAHGDSTQIEQVLVNLVVNAVDATPPNGRITVSTADLDSSGRTDNGDVLAPGKYVVLRVRDTGAGMDRETMSRIFEPFFTTKEPGRGTGLGLATVYGIVKQFGGQVFVQSAPGAGTTFEVCLPHTPHKPRTSGEKPVTRTDAHGSEVVMIVEDEPQVRAPMSRTLRHLGYFVLEAENGEDALARINEYHAPVHLLITDVMMPEMNGAELTSLLHSWYPNLKVLFVSGYNQEFLTSEGELPANVSYLAKPFTPDELAQRVRALLDENGGPSRGPARN